MKRRMKEKGKQELNRKMNKISKREKNEEVAKEEYELLIEIEQNQKL